MTIKDNGDGTLLVTLTTKEQNTVTKKPGALEVYLTSWLESWGREFFTTEATTFKGKYDKLGPTDQAQVLAILAKVDPDPLVAPEGLHIN